MYISQVLTHIADVILKLWLVYKYEIQTENVKGAADTLSSRPILI